MKRKQLQEKEGSNTNYGYNKTQVEDLKILIEQSSSSFTDIHEQNLRCLIKQAKNADGRKDFWKKIVDSMCKE